VHGRIAARLDGTGEQFSPGDALGPDVPTVVVRYRMRLSTMKHTSRLPQLHYRKTVSTLFLESHSPVPLQYPLRLNLPAASLAASCVHLSCERHAAFFGLALPFLGLMPPQRAPSAFSDFLVMDACDPALRQMQLDARKSASPVALVARLKAIARVNVSDQLRTVDLPTLYMRATEDRSYHAVLVSTFTTCTSRTCS